MNNSEYEEREMGLDWSVYYASGMSESEAQAFKAGWRAGYDLGSQRTG